MGRPMHFEHDVVVVGGCGHVGLPLGLAFADSGLDVVLYDTDAAVVGTVNGGAMPFAEVGAPDVLKRVLASGRLRGTTDASVIDRGVNLVVVVGTPVHRTVRSRTGGGGAPQAVHQQLAVSQVRGRQPAVHDRQRQRARLRADS